MASLKYYNKTTNQWEYVNSNPESSDILIDNTLTQADQAADAKAVGDALDKKLSADELPNAVNDALAQAKASGEFDGKDGTSATHSWNGTVLTITSASGTSSANLKGEKGDKGDSIKGDTGSPGADGVSPTVSVSKSGKVTTISITDKNGTKTATINDGAVGSPGSPGKTPVKGVDYWTEADKESIVQEVIAALGTPVFGRVDADNNIILTGNLVNGTYILKYEDAKGNQTDIGTVTIGGSDGTSYTNALTLAVDENGNPFVGANGEVGYKTGYRLSFTSGNESALADYEVTGYIPVTYGDKIRIKNITIPDGTGEDMNNHYICFYDANKTCLLKTTLIAQFVTNGTDEGNGVRMMSTSGINATDMKYFRICGSEITADSIITVNQEIVGDSTQGYTNLADPTSADWLTDQRLNSSGTGTACEGAVVTNFISVTADDVIRVKGINFASHKNYSSAPKNGVWSSSGTANTSAANATCAMWEYSTENNEEISVYKILSTAAVRFRLSGDLIGTAEDVIITKNEEIV